MKSKMMHKIIGLIVLTIVVANFVILGAPQPARAQTTDPVVAANTAAIFWKTTSIDINTWYANMKADLREVQAKLGETIKKSLVLGTTTTLINLMTYMANRFAYDAAVWVASGGDAENPLFDPRPAEDYLRYVGASIASEVINDINEANIFEGRLEGFNLCVPVDSYLLMALRIGARGAFERPELEIPDVPGCSILDILDNFEGFLVNASETITDPTERNEAILSAVSAQWDPNVAELTVGMTIYNETLTSAMQEAQLKISQFIDDNGFQPVVDFITGNVETPADMVQTEFYEATSQNKSVPYGIAQGLLSNTDALLQVGVMAGSVFTNTLLSEVINNIYEGAFADLIFDDSNPFAEEASSVASRERAQERLSSLLSFTPLQVSDFNLLSEFTSCPTSVRGTSRALYNCVMDTSFASAVARAQSGDALTVQEAIDEGYINGDWALIPSDDRARNQDSRCYQSAFCYANLVKLRKARIIPIGWELAADSEANTAADPATLQEVIDGFYDCNSEGELDVEHPWCHLIDPNWVLKAPQTQCRTLAYGQILETSGSTDRYEECVDIETCIAEDDSGNCTGGYGYCVREENVWHFRGDACPEQYASCLTFIDRDEVQVDYLQNTLDYTGCGEDSVGCLWYSTEQEAGDEGYDWPVVNDVAQSEAQAGAYQTRLYLTAETQDCEATASGCQQVVERDGSFTLNMIANPSFEIDSDDNGYPDGWQASISVSNLSYEIERANARTGERAMYPESDELIQNSIELSQGQFYTLSFFAKQSPGNSNPISAALRLYDEAGGNVSVSGYSYRGDCTATANGWQINAQPAGVDYEHYTCTFSTPIMSDRGATIYGTFVAGGQVWLDDIQLEQSETASIFTAGYSLNESELPISYLKLPPTYLGCTGNASDPDECSAYARVCSASNEGCARFTPVNGDPTVTAIVNELNQCPAACDGYDTYKQESTRFEPQGAFPLYFIPESARSCTAAEVGCDEFTDLADEQLAYFTYLRACVTEEQADQNSNSDQAAIFYTWEGSDQEGYQLREWNLLESDLAAGYAPYSYQASGEVDQAPQYAPCTNFVVDEAGIHCDDDANGDLRYDSELTSCDEHDDIFLNPNCREFYDTEGFIHYRNWQDTVTVNNDCHTYRKTESYGADELEQTANCETSGGYFDSTTNACLYYGYRNESATCSAAASGCREYTGGRSGNSRKALEDLFESGLGAWDASSAAAVSLSNESVATDGHSLRSQGQSVWTYLYDGGSDCDVAEGCLSPTGALGGQCTRLEGERYCGTLEGNLFEGKTYTISFWAKGSGDLDVGFDIAAGGSASIDVAFAQSITLSDGWQEFSFGPINASSLLDSRFANFGEGTVLVFAPRSGGEFFIDNVVLREGEQNITLIRQSWVTPAVCDQTETGIYSPQYHLGCREYLDQDGASVYLKSFARLCDEDQVGCTGFYQTQQSSSTTAQVYNATCHNLDGDGDGVPDTASAITPCYLKTSYFDQTVFDTQTDELCNISPGESECQFDLNYGLAEYLTDEPVYSHLEFTPDTQVVSGDLDIYVIDEPGASCSAGDMGCTELGLPTFSADRSVIKSWQTKYYLNLPDDYGEILCRDEALFCEAYSSEAGGTYYYQDPQNHTCEYKTDILIGGEKYDGWFRTDTSNFCYGSGYCSGSTATACSLDSDCAVLGLGECVINNGSYVVSGKSSGVWRNGDEDYEGWTGTCSAEYSGCSEFRDPLDVEEGAFYGTDIGESYFFIDNQNLDENVLRSESRCNGQVSSESGCVLFNDTSSTRLTYNASATYIASVHADVLFGDEPYSMVDPIDCSAQNTEITLPDSSTVDLCYNRCYYRKNRVDNISYVPAEVTRVRDQYYYGGSCLFDSDCAQVMNETGDMISGHCGDSVPGYGSLSGLRFNFGKRPNDANRVLKVSRDRQCSEWLTCSSSTTVWDEATASYRTICDGVALCDEYSTRGDSSYCSSWNSDMPAVLLNDDFYSARDISWYGSEYSGYAVPDIYPIQHLEQVNIAPPMYTCNFNDRDATDFELYQGNDCTNDNECGSGYCVTEQEEEYRLAFNGGSCSQDNGLECTVGYCAASGSSCSSDLGCEAGEGDCITGVCYAVSERLCESADDCESGESCNSGVCVTETGNCDINSNCASAGSTCFRSVATKAGICYRENCIVAIDGVGFDDDIGGEQQCRAFPEVDSPFGNTVVDEWAEWDKGTEDIMTRVSTPTIEDPYGRPDGFLQGGDAGNGSTLPTYVTSGYEFANLCANDQDCECSYSKASVGNSMPVYVDDDFYAGDYGICTSGEMAGALCDEDADCGTLDDPSTDDVIEGQAKCEEITNVDTILGLPGYCVERDSSININGQADEQACLTWFPVDQLAGSTDIYAKFKSAGYFDDVYMCSYVEPYADLLPSKLGESGNSGAIACADLQNQDCSKSNIDEDLDSCLANVRCPDGYYAIVGACGVTSTPTGSYANACKGSGRNDCPYVCIPQNAVHEDSGESCAASSVIASNAANKGTFDNGITSGIKMVPDGTGSSFQVDAYYNGFSDYINTFQDCVEGSYQYQTSKVLDTLAFKCSTQFTTGNQDCGDLGGANNQGYYYLDVKVRYYPACSEVIEVNDINEGYAWTDRIKEATGDDDLYTIPGYGYTALTPQMRFGETIMTPNEHEAGEYPFLVAACYDYTSANQGFLITESIVSTSSDNAEDCPSGYRLGAWPGDDKSDPGDPDARSFVRFSLEYIHNMLSGATWDLSDMLPFERLKQIYAWPAVGTRWIWSQAQQTYVQATDPGEGTDIDARDEYPAHNDTYDARAVHAFPPTVWSIDVNNCYGEFCQEGAPDNITVNSQDSGDQFVDGEFFRASMKFFAAADKDHMPIRRVIVDWGEGPGAEVGSTDDGNFYLNHRGLEEGETAESICSSGSDEWGMTPETCDPNHFSYLHNYFCTPSNLLGANGYNISCQYDSRGHVINSPCISADGLSCVFQPRVHIRDNWGWCTGVCDSASAGLNTDASDRCFDGVGDISSSASTYSECNYSLYPLLDRNTDPWVYYDGQVIITP